MRLRDLILDGITAFALVLSPFAMLWGAYLMGWT